ncbi:MAG: hypothetical protein ACREA2_15555 [Blastocatellia bacterium]
MKKSLHEFLETIRVNVSQRSYWSYSDKPMPCELDDDFHGLINLFSQASPAEREAILKRIDANLARALMAFSWRMGVWGARKNSREMLLKGLIALVIDGGKFDIRDTISIMPVLYHSAVKINVDPQSLFDEAAAYYPNDVAGILSKFPKRKPQDRSLQAFDYMEVSTPEGIDYKIS